MNNFLHDSAVVVEPPCPPDIGISYFMPDNGEIGFLSFVNVICLKYFVLKVNYGYFILPDLIIKIIIVVVIMVYKK